MIAYKGYIAKGFAPSDSWAMPIPFFLIFGIFTTLTGIIILKTAVAILP